MSTIILKQSFWKEFERTQMWKCIFLVLDFILAVVSYPIFLLFVLIFQDHSAETTWGFYSPMLLLLGVILAFASMIMCNYTPLSWLDIVGIDIILTTALFLCITYPIWSCNYREKMGYSTLF